MKAGRTSVINKEQNKICLLVSFAAETRHHHSHWDSSFSEHEEFFC